MMWMSVQKTLLAIVLTLSFLSCAQESSPTIAIDDVIETEQGPNEELINQLADLQSVQLQTDMNLRTLKNGILEFVSELPTGSKIKISENYQVYLNEFRDSNGELKRSSTGFISPIKILSVPTAYSNKFTAAVIQKINSTSTGLFISAATIAASETSAGTFAIIKAAPTGAGFLKHYSASGKPKFSFTSAINKRFGARLNVPTKNISSADKVKWAAIFKELQKVANRTVAAQKAYLYMNKTQAKAAALNFENYGIIPKLGAWTIATQVTAVNHGFPNVPCAEFQSEILRQAYTRAGYNVLKDFNTQKGNPLFWNYSSAVKNYSSALYAAGWVPWTTNKYKPITGAILFHGAGNSPGHTFLAGGHDGRIIVDNGAPQGRDLRKSSASVIEIQYQPGLFFLPPGINPSPW